MFFSGESRSLSTDTSECQTSSLDDSGKEANNSAVQPPREYIEVEGSLYQLAQPAGASKCSNSVESGLGFGFGLQSSCKSHVTTVLIRYL